MKKHRPLLRFTEFCRKADIQRTDLFRLLDDNCLKTVKRHGVLYIYGTRKNLHLARKGLAGGGQDSPGMG